LVALAVLSLAIAVTALTLTYRVGDTDTWVHMAIGEYTLAHGWPPIKEPSSFTAATHEFIAHEWLAGVLFALVYATGGVIGLIVSKFVLASTTYILVYQASRCLGARLSILLPSFACLLYIATDRVTERPHMFSTLLLAWYAWMFFRFRQGRLHHRWLYAMPSVQMLWTNLHGGHIQGLALVTCWALGEACMWARARSFGLGVEKALPGRDVLRLAALVPACAATCCLTPYGTRLLWFPFEMTSLEWVMATGGEWKPPSRESYFSPAFYSYVVHLAALWTTFGAVQRDPACGGANRVLTVMFWLTWLGLVYGCLHDPSVPGIQAIRATCLYGLLGLFVLFTLVNVRTVDVTQAGVIVLFVGLSLRHARCLADAALGTFPLLTASALLEGRPQAAFRPALQRRSDRSSVTAIILGACLLLGLSAHASIFSYIVDFRGFRWTPGIGLADACAVDFLVRHHQLKGHALVSFGAAPLLIYRMHPAVQVNIYAFDYVFGEDLWREYTDALRSPAAMRAYLRRYRIDFFVLWPWSIAPAVVDDLQAHGWVPVHYDDHTMILLPRRPDTEALIAHAGYWVINPTKDLLVTPENTSQVLEELTRMLRNCPRDRYAYTYQAHALRRLHRDAEAEAAFAADRDTPSGWFTSGSSTAR
jgi:hypothetical protein